MKTNNINTILSHNLTIEKMVLSKASHLLGFSRIQQMHTDTHIGTGGPALPNISIPSHLAGPESLTQGHEMETHIPDGLEGFYLRLQVDLLLPPLDVSPPFHSPKRPCARLWNKDRISLLPTVGSSSGISHMHENWIWQKPTHTFNVHCRPFSLSWQLREWVSVQGQLCTDGKIGEEYLKIVLTCTILPLLTFDECSKLTESISLSHSFLTPALLKTRFRLMLICKCAFNSYVSALLISPRENS